MDSYTGSFALFVSVVGLVLLLIRVYQPVKLPDGTLPPGPRPLPFIGNLLDIPNVRPWEAYRKLCRQHGDIISLRALGRTLIVVDKADIAVELLEKRSSIYSSRLQSTTIDLIGWGGWDIAMLPYGSWWRAHRRALAQHLHHGAISKYNSYHEENAAAFLRHLLHSPDQLVDHLRFAIGTTLMKTVYGLQLNDEYIRLFEEAFTSLDLLLNGSILDFAPFLAHVPTWLPGTGLLRRLAYYRPIVAAMRDVPWKDAKAAIDAGGAPASLASASMEKISRLEGNEAALQDDICRNALSLAYGGGIDTTHATLCAFFVAMSLSPEVQTKARAELDNVVGPSRLPTLSDSDNLPYIDAIVKETLRWHNAAPLLIPHYSTADDNFEGFFIPANSVVMVNAWSIMHDPETYPEPEKFIPERYLKDGKINPAVRDPASVIFGYGRRICPGRHFADASLFTYIASILHTLDISPPVDDDGLPIHIVPQTTTALTSRIEDCRCTIKPRSFSAEALILSTA
ncbi:cytochrome P450 [Lentinus tigrinus ALCF2SS1-7]|uniref:Cytochrome P450 n=1 Tax=Lentinus tigrinus ALCF2SS1-6 TaxID=1328759 RepID=A0A5C2SFP6_9APHY|nr:cytochrome P450 [Lentinus tigrinus ALCF2SS1-6]RPD77618.1 cytochrome P450 [Lentinus tigrinus ALCF2SS1-7]